MHGKERLPAVAIDTREQLPWDFGPLPTVRAKLDAGDYSLEGHESRIAIERKSKEDAWGCVAQGRERFERCLQRLADVGRPVIIIEADLRDFQEPPPYVKRVTGATAVGSYLSWMTRWRIPVVWAHNREWAQRVALRILMAYWKHRG